MFIKEKMFEKTLKVKKKQAQRNICVQPVRITVSIVLINILIFYIFIIVLLVFRTLAFI